MESLITGDKIVAWRESFEKIFPPDKEEEDASKQFDAYTAFIKSDTSDVKDIAHLTHRGNRIPLDAGGLSFIMAKRLVKLKELRDKITTKTGDNSVLDSYIFNANYCKVFRAKFLPLMFFKKERVIHLLVDLQIKVSDTKQDIILWGVPLSGKTDDISDRYFQFSNKINPATQISIDDTKLQIVHGEGEISKLMTILVEKSKELSSNFDTEAAGVEFNGFYFAVHDRLKNRDLVSQGKEAGRFLHANISCDSIDGMDYLISDCITYDGGIISTTSNSRAQAVPFIYLFLGLIVGFDKDLSKEIYMKSGFRDELKSALETAIAFRGYKSDGVLFKVEEFKTKNIDTLFKNIDNITYLLEETSILIDRKDKPMPFIEGFGSVEIIENDDSSSESDIPAPLFSFLKSASSFPAATDIRLYLAEDFIKTGSPFIQSLSLSDQKSIDVLKILAKGTSLKIYERVVSEWARNILSFINVVKGNAAGSSTKGGGGGGKKDGKKDESDSGDDEDLSRREREREEERKRKEEARARRLRETTGDIKPSVTVFKETFEGIAETYLKQVESLKGQYKKIVDTDGDVDKIKKINERLNSLIEEMRKKQLSLSEVFKKLNTLDNGDVINEIESQITMLHTVLKYAQYQDMRPPVLTSEDIRYLSKKLDTPRLINTVTIVEQVNEGKPPEIEVLDDTRIDIKFSVYSSYNLESDIDVQVSDAALSKDTESYIIINSNTKTIDVLPREKKTIIKRSNVYGSDNFPVEGHLALVVSIKPSSTLALLIREGTTKMTSYFKLPKATAVRSEEDFDLSTVIAMAGTSVIVFSLILKAEPLKYGTGKSYHVKCATIRTMPITIAEPELPKEIPTV
jgi:hypothetical protein